MRKIVWLGLAVIIFLCSACGGNPDSLPPRDEPPPISKPSTETITLAVMGDFLMHMPVVYSVRNPETGRYEFGTIFEPVRELISAADYSIANLETRLAGEAVGYSGYPRFNCPTDLAAEMRRVGLDMFLTANNHSLDRGVEGVINTNRNLAEAGLDYIGTYVTEAEKNTPFVKEIRGVRLGIMNYTEHTNGLTVPKDKPFLVNIYDPAEIQREIALLQDAGADIIIACIHFGTEYSREPHEGQLEKVNFLFDAGVDVVVGNHVHVVQPVLIKTVVSSGMERKKIAAFSLGNFISNQRWRYSDSGLLLQLSITKNMDSGETILTGHELTPVWVHTYLENGRNKYRVLPVNQFVESYANGNDRHLTKADYQRLKQVADELNSDFLIR